MDLLIIIFFLIVIYKISFKQTDNYMSKKYCNCLKGIFAMVIVFVHISYGRNEFEIFDIFKYFGQFVVGCFFFISGYGLYLKLREKGKNNVLNKYLYKRIYLLLKRYLFIYVLYLFVLLITGAFSDNNWVSILLIPRSWYIFIAIILYFSLYLIIKYLNKNVIFFQTVFIFSLFLLLIIFGVSEYCYISLFAFSGGMLFYSIKDIIKNDIIYFLVVIIIFVTSEFIQFKILNIDLILSNSFLKILKYLLQNVGVVAFTFLIFRMGKYIRFENEITSYLGTISLEIYLIHPIYELLFQNIYFINKYSIVYGLFVVIFTLLTSIMYKKVFLKLNC